MNRYDALRILGLGPEATLEEARRAYRDQVKLWHPDRYSDNSALKSMALKNAQDANRAWAFLRSRLPPSSPARQAIKVAATPSPGFRRRQAVHAIETSRKARLFKCLTCCVDWVAPLIGRIRQIQIAGIAGWLKEDPMRGYRPWYRYSRHAGRHTPKSGSPTFSQTLAEVMQDRSSGFLKVKDYPRRERPPSGAVPLSAERRDRCDEGRIVAVDPVGRSRQG